MAPHHQKDRARVPLTFVAAIFALCLIVRLTGGFLNAQTPVGQPASSVFLSNPSLVGWWTMDESNRTTVLDRSWNHLNGVLNNFQSTPTAASGFFSNALPFSANSLVNFGNNPVLNLPNGFTLSAWVRGSNTTDQTTLARWSGINGSAWELGLSSNGVAQLSFLAGSTTQTVVGIKDAMNVRDGNWHHVAGVYGASQSQATLYVDGAQEASQKVMNWFPSQVQSFVLGRSAVQPNPSFILDEVQLYGTPFSMSNLNELLDAYGIPAAAPAPNSIGSTQTPSSSNTLAGATTSNQLNRVVGVNTSSQTMLGAGFKAQPAAASGSTFAITNRYEKLVFGGPTLQDMVKSSPFPCMLTPTRVVVLQTGYQFDDRGSVGGVQSDGMPESTSCGTYNHSFIGDKEIPLSSITVTTNNELQVGVTAENNPCAGGPHGYFLTIVWEADVTKVESVMPSEGCVGFKHDVIIKGAGFVAPVTVKVDDSNVSVKKVKLVNNTTITAEFDIDVNATGGKKDVIVTTRGISCTGPKLFKVQIPSSLNEVARGVAPDGTRGQFSFQVVDQDGEAIKQAKLQPLESLIETITVFNKNTNQILFTTSPQSASGKVGSPTDPVGRFNDTPVGVIPQSLVSLRKRFQVDIRTSSLQTKDYSMKIKQTSFAVGGWQQDICQTAELLQPGNVQLITTGNCGVTEERR